MSASLSLSICALNVLSLVGDHRVEELEAAAHKVNADIIGLSEVRRPSQAAIDLNSGMALYHGARDFNRTGGVGFLVSARLSRQVSQFVALGPRLAFLDVVLSRCALLRVWVSMHLRVATLW